MTRRTSRPHRRGRRPGRLDGRDWLALGTLALGLAAVVAWTVGSGDVLGRPGVGGGLWIGLLGLASAGSDGEFVADLVDRIERVRAGEDGVDFETDRTDDVAGLYDAVAGLAAETTDDGGEDAEYYRRELYRITSDTDLSDEAKLRQLLELGVDRLGVENGLVTRINPETGYYEVETVAGGDFVEAGTEADLSETFCQRTIASEEVLGIADTTVDYAEDPASLQWGIETYIGGKVEVGPDLYGTVCFVDPDPRERSFTPDERAFVHQMARWLSYRFERRRDEERLRASERRFQAVFGDPDRLVALLDVDGTVRQCNGSAAAYGSEGLAETQGQQFAALSLWRGPEAATVEGWIERASAGEYVEFEATVCGPEGEERSLDGVVRPVTDDDGSVLSLVVTARDVTELRQRERDLRRHRQYTEDVLDATADVFYVLDEEGTFTRWNQRLAAVTGYDDEAIASMTATDLFDEADRPAIAAAIEQVQETGHSRVEAPFLTSDGDEIPYEFQADAVETPDGERVVTGIGRDVTERRERERELRETKRRLEIALEGTNTGIFDWDMETDEVVWSETFERVLGLDPGGFGGTFDAFEERLHPEDADEVEQQIESAVDGEGRYEADFRLRHQDGSWRWIHARGRIVDDDEGRRMVGINNEVTERRERERELRRTRDLLEQAQQIADVGGWELDLTRDPPEMNWTDALYRLHGLAPQDGVEFEEAMELYHPEDRERIQDTMDAAIESGEGYDIEFRIRREGEYRWVRALAETVEKQGDVVALRGSIQDVSPEKEREWVLESLHEVARDLLRAESETAVTERVVATARKILDADRVAAYLIDDATTRLDPVASAGFEADGPPVVPVGDDGPVWTAYATAEPVAMGDDPDASTASDGTGLAVPVGDYGVFVVATEAGSVDDETRKLLGTLVATTAAALDRIASEAALLARDAEMEARNSRLERQIAITDIIRGIDRTLIGAESREEVERTVCERLVEADDVAFAWIGGRDAASESVVPRTWAGGSATYLDEVGLERPAGTDEPGVVAERAGSSTVVENVVADVGEADWRRPAMAAGYHSVVAVPITHQGFSHGVLAVYADEPEAFGDLEEVVFAELGEGIANAIDAIQAREALYADSLLRLTLALPTGSVLGRIAEQTDCTVEYEGLVSQSETETRLFFAASGAPAEAIRASVADLVPITECRLVSDQDEQAVFEVAIAGDSLPAKLVRHGGRPRSITASGSETEVAVDVPTSTDVREFVAMLQEPYPGVELTARRNVQRTKRTRQELISSLFEELTDRQLEVLRTAYFAGFFEWPRESTGEEVAEMLGVTQPTVNRHLRLGQARLLAQLFEEVAESTVVTV